MMRAYPELTQTDRCKSYEHGNFKAADLDVPLSQKASRAFVEARAY
jgi:hypothetical protein